MPATDLTRALAQALHGDVESDATARALTTMDASNYRRVPQAVVAPRDTADVAEALRICREHATPSSPAAAAPPSQARPPAPESSWTSPATCGASSTWTPPPAPPSSSPASSWTTCGPPPPRTA